MDTYYLILHSFTASNPSARCGYCDKHLRYLPSYHTIIDGMHRYITSRGFCNEEHARLHLKDRGYINGETNIVETSTEETATED